MMRTFLLLVTASLATSLPSVAVAQDTTRTLFASLPFRGAHIAVGPGVMPYLDHSSKRGEGEQVKLMLTLRRFPEWSFGLTSTAVNSDTTSYIASRSVTTTSSGYKARLMSHAGAIEVQRRWRSSQLIHPLASVAAGRITNFYYYTEFTDGRARQFDEETTGVGFVQLSAGGEMNLARWLRGNFMVGYRTGGRMTIQQAAGDNGGFTAFANLALGKF